MCRVLRAAAILEGRVVFATEETSPFDVAVVELEESVPGFVSPCLADTFLQGKCPGGHGILRCHPLVPTSHLSPPQERR